MDPQKVFERYFNLSLRFISFRPRSEKEVIDYLGKKLSKAKSVHGEVVQDESVSGGLDEKTIARIMQRLTELKFIEDLSFAKFWIEQRTRIKPKALNAIKFELIYKGVSKEIIEQGLKELGKNATDDLRNAEILVERKMRSLKLLSREKRDQKIIGYLSRRGFDYEIIKRVIKNPS